MISSDIEWYRMISTDIKWYRMILWGPLCLLWEKCEYFTRPMHICKTFENEIVALPEITWRRGSHFCRESNNILKRQRNLRNPLRRNVNISRDVCKVASRSKKKCCSPCSPVMLGAFPLETCELSKKKNCSRSSHSHFSKLQKNSRKNSTKWPNRVFVKKLAKIFFGGLSESTRAQGASPSCAAGRQFPSAPRTRGTWWWASWKWWKLFVSRAVLRIKKN